MSETSACQHQMFANIRNCKICTKANFKARGNTEDTILQKQTLQKERGGHAESEAVFKRELVILAAHTDESNDTSC